MVASTKIGALVFSGVMMLIVTPVLFLLSWMSTSTDRARERVTAGLRDGGGTRTSEPRVSVARRTVFGWPMAVSAVCVDRARATIRAQWAWIPWRQCFAGPGSPVETIEIKAENVDAISFGLVPLELTTVAWGVLNGFLIGTVAHFLPCLDYSCDLGDGDNGTVRGSIWIVASIVFIALLVLNRESGIRVQSRIRGDFFAQVVIPAQRGAYESLREEVAALRSTASGGRSARNSKSGRDRDRGSGSSNRSSSESTGGDATTDYSETSSYV
jgi:hypothetical protein